MVVLLVAILLFQQHFDSRCNAMYSIGQPRPLAWRRATALIAGLTLKQGGNALACGACPPRGTTIPARAPRPSPLGLTRSQRKAPRVLPGGMGQGGVSRLPTVGCARPVRERAARRACMEGLPFRGRAGRQRLAYVLSPGCTAVRAAAWKGLLRHTAFGVRSPVSALRGVSCARHFSFYATTRTPVPPVRACRLPLTPRRLWLFHPVNPWQSPPGLDFSHDESRSNAGFGNRGQPSPILDECWLGCCCFGHRLGGVVGEAGLSWIPT
jgi:hypothetical protein